MFMLLVTGHVAVVANEIRMQWNWIGCMAYWISFPTGLRLYDSNFICKVRANFIVGCWLVSNLGHFSLYLINFKGLGLNQAMFIWRLWFYLGFSLYARTYIIRKRAETHSFWFCENIVILWNSRATMGERSNFGVGEEIYHLGFRYHLLSCKNRSIHYSYDSYCIRLKTIWIPR